MESKSTNSKIIEYPKKPKRGELHKKSINVICNLKQINFKEALKGKHIMTYEISFIPEITNEKNNEKENNLLKKKILRQLKEDLTGIFENYFLIGNTIFVCTKKSKSKITLETKYSDIDYQVIFTKVSDNFNCEKINQITKDDIRKKIFVENIIKNIITANNHIIKFNDGAFYDYYDIETCPFRSIVTHSISGHMNTCTAREHICRLIGKRACDIRIHISYTSVVAEALADGTYVLADSNDLEA